MLAGDRVDDTDVLGSKPWRLTSRLVSLPHQFCRPFSVYFRKPLLSVLLVLVLLKPELTMSISKALVEVTRERVEKLQGSSILG